jgi:hypothetical protein
MKVFPNFVRPDLLPWSLRKPLSSIGQHELIALFDSIAAFPESQLEHFSVLQALLAPVDVCDEARNLDDRPAPFGSCSWKIKVTAHPTEDH